MVARLRPFNDLRYHISWVWGHYLNYIPRRLGKNQALDAAVATLLSGHADACLKSRSTNRTEPMVAESTVTLYGRALRELRSILDDPAQCSETETLCAVMVNSITQGRLEGPISSWCSAHAAGALQLWKMQRLRPGRDDLESHLYYHLRDVVLMNSFVNPAIILSSLDYRSLEASCSQDPIEIRFVSCIVAVSEMIAQARVMIVQQSNLEAIALRARQVQQLLQLFLTNMRNRLYRLDRSTHDPLIATMLHSLYQRLYGFSLALYAILLCARQSLTPEDLLLDHDVAQLSSQALQLADEAKAYRPLGAMWLVAVLMPIWCAARDADTIAKIEAVILEYRSYAMGPIGVVPMDQLQWMARRLSLRC